MAKGECACEMKAFMMSTCSGKRGFAGAGSEGRSSRRPSLKICSGRGIVSLPRLLPLLSAVRRRVAVKLFKTAVAVATPGLSASAVP